MKAPPPESTLVVGIGNRWRHDDGAGLAVAEALRDLSPANVTVALCETDPMALLDLDPGAATRLLLIDAAEAPRGPCRTHRFRGADPPLKRAFPTSCHSFGLAETLALARNLGRWPDDTVVFAVEGWNFSHGEGLSAEAALATQECIRLVIREILPPEFLHDARPPRVAYSALK